MSDHASFAVGQMHQSEVERFVAALDRQGQMDVVQTLRGWVREQLGISTGATVGDVGCGTGEELIRLAGIVGDRGRAIGIDANEPMLEIARERTAGIAGIDIVKAEAAHLPFDDGECDALVCERVLQHLTYDPADAVREFARVMKPGGFLGLTDTDWSSLHVIVVDDPDASAHLQAIRERVPLPFTTNQQAGKHLEEFCATAGLQVVTRHSLILGDFAPALVRGVRTGLSAAAATTLSASELTAAEGLLDGALERDALKLAVRLHAVVASKVDR